MATKQWESLRCLFCEHAGMEVSLEAEVIYPADHLNDQTPRIESHRCSNAAACNQLSQDSCVWAGTNSVVDPFKS